MGNPGEGRAWPMLAARDEGTGREDGGCGAPPIALTLESDKTKRMGGGDCKLTSLSLFPQLARNAGGVPAPATASRWRGRTGTTQPTLHCIDGPTFRYRWPPRRVAVRYTYMHGTLTSIEPSSRYELTAAPARIRSVPAIASFPAPPSITARPLRDPSPLPARGRLNHPHLVREDVARSWFCVRHAPRLLARHHAAHTRAGFGKRLGVGVLCPVAEA